MNKGKCGYLGCISDWFVALRGPLGPQKADLRCQDTGRVSGNGFRRNFTVGWAHTTGILTSEVVCILTYFKQDQCDEGGVTAIGRYHQIGLKICRAS